MSPVTLLGPQRLRPCLRDVCDARGLAGPVALITAGWEEREDEDAELTEHLGLETVNLRLFGRTEEVFGVDDELYGGLVERKDEMRALQDVYRMRLGHALAAARDLFARDGEAELLVPERADALAAVAALDDHHLQRVRDVHAAFEERWRPAERPEMARHAEEVTGLIDGCEAVAIAGGHVKVLLNRLRLFDLLEPLRARPILAWSAGAMALTEKVVAFHDSPPQGAGDPEVLEAGLGLAPGVVALPSARRRLRLGDPVRVALLARRFEPAASIALDEGDHVTLETEITAETAATPPGQVPVAVLASGPTGGGGARRLRPTGEVERMVPA